MTFKAFASHSVRSLLAFSARRNVLEIFYCSNGQGRGFNDEGGLRSTACAFLSREHFKPGRFIKARYAQILGPRQSCLACGRNYRLKDPPNMTSANLNLVCVLGLKPQKGLEKFLAHPPDKRHIIPELIGSPTVQKEAKKPSCDEYKTTFVLRRNEWNAHDRTSDEKARLTKAAHEKVLLLSAFALFTGINNFPAPLQLLLAQLCRGKKLFQKKGASQISESDKPPRNVFTEERRGKSENKLHCYVCHNTINLLPLGPRSV